MSRNYAQVRELLQNEWQFRFIRPATPYPFEVLRTFLAQVGLDPAAIPAIAVAGSKGKSCVTALASAILTAHGQRVASFTSPHLIEPRERISFDGVPINETLFCEAFNRVYPDDFAEAFPELSFYEVLLAAFLWVAGKRRADIIVVEVGLGGRRDPTRVVPAQTVVLGPVTLEHTQRLGPTVLAIATEKIGRLNAGATSMFISASQEPLVQAYLIDRCATEGIRLRRAGIDFAGVLRASDSVGIEGSHRALDLAFDWRSPLLGTFEVENITLAIEAARAGLATLGHPFTVEQAQAALARLTLRGRLETMRTDPPLIFDGAHTTESARELAQSLAMHFGEVRFDLVVGMQRRHDLAAFLAELAPIANDVLLTNVPHARGLSLAQSLRIARLAGFGQAQGAGPEDALRFAVYSGRPVLVTGSLYLYALAKQAIR